jgi:hypothetical protein
MNDCMKSFNFRIVASGNVGTNLKTWTTGAGLNYFAVNNNLLSTFDVQGFKNISVYEIEVVGGIQTNPTAATGGIIVNNWTFELQITGNQPILGGVFGATNNYLLELQTNKNRTFSLGKYTNSLKFSSPFESVTNLRFGNTYVDGIGWENLLDVNISWDLNFIIHYKFEGEE